MNELADQFKDKPVQFVALTEEDRRTVESSLVKKPIHAWVGVADHSTLQSYGVMAIPMTVLVRGDGVVDSVTYPTALRPEHLQNLLAGKPSGIVAQPAQSGMARPGELPEADAHSSLFQIIIRPTSADRTAVFGGHAGGGPLGPEIGKSFVGHTVRDLLPLVYETSVDRIVVNGALPDGKYDIVVKIPETGEKHLGLRVQQALESTFGLTSRHETREIDVYVATVAAGKAKGLTAATTPSPARLSSNVATGTLSGVNAPITVIVRILERGLSRPVIDETKLGGRYDVDLKWDPSAGRDGEVRAVSDQLGILLTPAKRQVDMVIIGAPPAAAATRATRSEH
jgi:uncharacterized protein (TIGR03435 family)